MHLQAFSYGRYNQKNMVIKIISKARLAHSVQFMLQAVEPQINSCPLTGYISDSPRANLGANQE